MPHFSDICNDGWLFNNAAAVISFALNNTDIEEIHFDVDFQEAEVRLEIINTTHHSTASPCYMMNDVVGIIFRLAFVTPLLYYRKETTDICRIA